MANKLWDTIKGVLTGKNKNDEEKKASAGSSGSGSSAYSASASNKGTSSAAEPTKPAITSYNSGIATTKAYVDANKESYKQQYNLARQAGLTDQQFLDQYRNGTRWADSSSSRIRQYNSGVATNKAYVDSHMPEYRTQYNLAKKAGINDNDFVSLYGQGYRWNDDSKPTVVSYQRGSKPTKEYVSQNQDEYREQYNLAREAGYNDDEFLEAYRNGTMWRYSDAGIGANGKTLAEDENYNQSWIAKIRAGIADNAIGERMSQERLKKLQDKYGKEVFSDDFWGQAKANFGIGRIQEELNQATSDYLDNPTEENRRYRQELLDLLDTMYKNNAQALDDEGVQAGWLSKTMAGYLPQLWYQTKASLAPAAAAAGAGAAIGAGGGTMVLPIVGTVGGGVAGAVAGLGVGLTAGSAIYSYDAMRGAAFNNLVELGVDELTAMKAARDEAVISSVIESGDTAWDYLSFVFSGGTSAAVKAGTKATEKAAAKGIMAGIKKYLKDNVAGEYSEEFIQEIISMANQKRIANGDTDTGITGLLSDTFDLIKEMVSGNAKEELAQAHEAGTAGAIIGGVMGGAKVAGGHIYQGYTNTQIRKSLNHVVEEEKTGRIKGYNDTAIQQMLNAAENKATKNDKAAEILRNEIVRRKKEDVFFSRVNNEETNGIIAELNAEGEEAKRISDEATKKNLDVITAEDVSPNNVTTIGLFKLKREAQRLDSDNGNYIVSEEIRRRINGRSLQNTRNTEETAEAAPAQESVQATAPVEETPAATPEEQLPANPLVQRNEEAVQTPTTNAEPVVTDVLAEQAAQENTAEEAPETESLKSNPLAPKNQSLTEEQIRALDNAALAVMRTRAKNSGDQRILAIVEDELAKRSFNNNQNKAEKTEPKKIGVNDRWANDQGPDFGEGASNTPRYDNNGNLVDINGNPAMPPKRQSRPNRQAENRVAFGETAKNQEAENAEYAGGPVDATTIDGVSGEAIPLSFAAKDVAAFAENNGIAEEELGNILLALYQEVDENGYAAVFGHQPNAEDRAAFDVMRETMEGRDGFKEAIDIMAERAGDNEVSDEDARRAWGQTLLNALRDEGLVYSENTTTNVTEQTNQLQTPGEATRKDNRITEERRKTIAEEQERAAEEKARNAIAESISEKEKARETSDFEKASQRSNAQQGEAKTDIITEGKELAAEISEAWGYEFQTPNIDAYAKALEDNKNPMTLKKAEEMQRLYDKAEKEYHELREMVLPEEVVNDIFSNLEETARTFDRAKAKRRPFNGRQVYTADNGAEQIDIEINGRTHTLTTQEGRGFIDAEALYGERYKEFRKFLRKIGVADIIFADGRMLRADGTGTMVVNGITARDNKAGTIIAVDVHNPRALLHEIIHQLYFRAIKNGHGDEARNAIYRIPLWSKNPFFEKRLKQYERRIEKLYANKIDAIVDDNVNEYLRENPNASRDEVDAFITTAYRKIKQAFLIEEILARAASGQLSDDSRIKTHTIRSDGFKEFIFYATDNERTTDADRDMAEASLYHLYQKDDYSDVGDIMYEYGKYNGLLDEEENDGQNIGTGASEDKLVPEQYRAASRDSGTSASSSANKNDAGRVDQGRESANETTKSDRRASGQELTASEEETNETERYERAEEEAEKVDEADAKTSESWQANEMREIEEMLSEMSRERDEQNKQPAKKKPDNVRETRQKFTPDRSEHTKEGRNQYGNEKAAEGVFMGMAGVSDMTFDFDRIVSEYERETGKDPLRAEDEEIRNAAKAKQAVDKLRKLCTDVAEGKRSFGEFAKFYLDMANDRYLASYYDQMTADYMRDAYQLYEASKAEKTDYDVIRYTYAAERAAKVLAHRMARVEGNITTARQLQTEVGRYAPENKQHKTKLGNLGKQIKDFLIRMQGNPSTMMRGLLGGFDRFSNNLGYQIGDRIDKANINHQKIIAGSQLRFADVKQMDGFRDFALGKDAKDVKLNSGTFRMTQQQMAHLYMSAKTLLASVELGENRLETLRGFGFKDANGNTHTIEFQDEKEANINAESPGRTTLKDIMRSLWGEMNDVSKAYLEAWADIAEDLGKRNADADENVTGIRPHEYKKGDYIQLRYISDPDILRADTNDNTDTIFSYGFQHERTRTGGGYVRIENISEAVDRYINQSANHIAYAELGDDLRTMNRNTDFSRSISGMLERAYGKQYSEWVDNYIDDLTNFNPKESTDPVNSLLRAGRQAVQTGALVGSLSVPLKQISSYWAASGKLRMSTLRKAYRLKFIPAKNASAGNLLAEYRKIGGIDPTISEALTQGGLMKKLHQESRVYQWMEKQIPKKDFQTIDNLYTACMIEAQEDNPNLDINSQAFKDIVNDKFEDVVISTQPIFTKNARAEYARTDNEFIKLFSMFRTQQTQNLNRIVQSIGEARAAKGTAGEFLAQSEMQETIKGQAASALSLAVLSVVADALLHKTKKYKDEDDEIAVDKILERIGLNAIESAAGTVWFGDSVLKYAIDTINKFQGKESSEFYGVNMGIVSTISNVTESIGWFIESPTLSNARYVAGYISQALGIPLNNAYMMLNSAVMYANDLAGKAGADTYTGYDDVLKMIDKEIMATSGDTKSNKANVLVNAYMRGKIDKADKVAGMMYDADTEIRSEVKKRVLDGKMTIEQSENLLHKYTSMAQEDIEKKNALWEFVKEHPEYDNVSESFVQKYETYAEPANIPANKFYDYYEHFNNTKGIDEDGDGKADITKQQQIIDYINGLPLTKAQKDMLWQAFGYKTTSKAFKKRPWR